MEHFLDTPLLVKLICWTRLKSLSEDERSSLFGVAISDEEKQSFATSTPGPNVIKLFTHFLNKLECLSRASLSSLV